MSVPQNCPICMDNIVINTNCVNTECGHCFHASCLMRNIAYNGFGCPYCRTKMTEDQDNDNDSEYNVVSEYGDDEEDEDNLLRGVRLFFNNINGTQADEEDLEAEELFAIQEVETVEEIVNQAALVPSVDVIVKKLKDQNITYEQLINLILYQDHEEYEFLNADHFNDALFGKIRIMVSNYIPL